MSSRKRARSKTPAKSKGKAKRSIQPVPIELSKQSIPDVSSHISALFNLIRDNDENIVIEAIAACLPSRNNETNHGPAPPNLLPGLAKSIMEAFRHVLYTDPFDHLDPDVITGTILQFFSAWELCCFRGVSKSWRTFCEKAMRLQKFAELTKHDLPEHLFREDRPEQRQLALNVLNKYTPDLELTAIALSEEEGYDVEDVTKLLTNRNKLKSFRVDCEDSCELDMPFCVKSVTDTLTNHCQHLRTMALGLRLSDADLEAVGKALPNLQALQLRLDAEHWSHQNDLITSQGLATYLGLARRLLVLELINTARLAQPFPADCRAHVRRLSLETVQLTDVSFKSLISAVGPELRSLAVFCDQMDEAEVSDDAFELFAQHCPKLQELSLIETQTTSSFLREIALLPQLRFFAICPPEDEDVEDQNGNPIAWPEESDLDKLRAQSASPCLVTEFNDSWDHPERFQFARAVVTERILPMSAHIDSISLE